MDAKSILLVEDDRFEADRILESLASWACPVAVQLAESVHAAVAALQVQAFDTIILDMALPSHDLRPGVGQASSLLSGGLEVIMELNYLARSERVIILTQYPEIEIEGRLVSTKDAKSTISELYKVRVEAVIIYDHQSKNWVSMLIAAMG